MEAVALPPGPVTSPFGWRDFLGRRHFHNGADFRVTPASPGIPAAMDGVVHSRIRRAGGLCAVLNGSDGRTAIYGHLGAVRNGPVRRGEIFAIGANTGLATTGPHVHVTILDRDGNAVDPLSIPHFSVSPADASIAIAARAVGMDVQGGLEAHSTSWTGPEGGDVHFELNPAGSAQADTDSSESEEALPAPAKEGEWQITAKPIYGKGETKYPELLRAASLQSLVEQAVAKMPADRLGTRWPALEVAMVPGESTLWRAIPWGGSSFIWEEVAGLVSFYTMSWKLGPLTNRRVPQFQITMGMEQKANVLPSLEWLNGLIGLTFPAIKPGSIVYSTEANSIGSHGGWVSAGSFYNHDSFWSMTRAWPAAFGTDGKLELIAPDIKV